MKHQILIIDSSQHRADFLSQLIKQLIKHDFWFWFLGRRNSLFDKFQYYRWPSRIHFFGWLKNNQLASLWLWYLSLINFCHLLWYKQVRQVQTVVCVNWPEKIVITPLAKFLGLKVVWLELPNFDYQQLKPRLLSKIKQCALQAKMICFTSATRKSWLDFDIPAEQCHLVLPGIKLDDYIYQDNIFNKLAVGNSNIHKQFTIGTVIDYKEEQRIEMLLQALEICLGLDPDMRLVIIGNTEHRKKINWLVRKMHLEHHVWLVSDEVSLKKWFSNFDIFAIASTVPDLNDISIALGAMANKLTVIGPAQASLGDLSFNNQAMIITDMTSGEDLARQIIKLQQEPERCKQLGVNAKAVVEKYYLFDRMIKELLTII